MDDDLEAIRAHTAALVNEFQRQRRDRRERNVVVGAFLLLAGIVLVAIGIFWGQIVDAIAKRAERASIEARQEYLDEMTDKAREERIMDLEFDGLLEKAGYPWGDPPR